MQTQHGPDDKRKPCGKKRKQKTPKTGPDRAPRHDKGVAKKSMVSELTGIKGLGEMDDIRREGRYFIDRTITFYLFIFSVFCKCVNKIFSQYYSTPVQCFLS